MLSGLDMALRVMIASNSAFAKIRDNDHRYFPWSLGIFLFVYILFAVIDPRTPILERQSNIVTETATSILGGVAYATVIYLVGRLLDGNKRWRQVFSVIFYTHIISIPILVVVVLAALTFSILPWLSLPLGLVLMLLFLCWGLVVEIKAVKVVNGFGTAKAFGLIVLAAVITIIMYTPLIISYYQEMGIIL